MKKYILVFILGGIFFSSLSVFATLTYSANQITYTKGNNTMYLSDAMDELYTTQNTTLTNLQNTVSSYSSSRIFFQVISGAEVHVKFNDLYNQNFKTFKGINTWKRNSSTTCDISKLMDTVNNTTPNSNYTFDQTYSVPNTTNRLIFKATNGACDFNIYLYR